MSNLKIKACFFWKGRCEFRWKLFIDASNLFQIQLYFWFKFILNLLKINLLLTELKIFDLIIDTVKHSHSMSFIDYFICFWNLLLLNSVTVFWKSCVLWPHYLLCCFSKGIRLFLFFLLSFHVSFLLWWLWLFYRIGQSCINFNILSVLNFSFWEI